MDKRVLGVLLVPLFLLRWAWVRDDFERRSALFPVPTTGLFRLWVAEEPQVFLEREEGGHSTGRIDGAYEPGVREVRMVCRLLSRDGVLLPSEKVRCSLFLAPGEGPRPVLSYGDLLEVRGKVQRPDPPLNPGQFDYPRFLRVQDVPFILYASPGKWARVPGERRGWALPRLAAGLKRGAEGILYRYLPFPQNALLVGILLGERSPIPEDVVRSFFLTGTIHILAVSGMMTAFLAGLCFMVLRALQVPRRWAAGLTLPLLLVFVLVTGAHPPVRRAAIFSSIALVGLLLERRVRGGTLLVGTALLLLFSEPFLWEDLSFQISFLATAGLMVTAAPLMERMGSLWRPAAFLVTATLAAQFSVFGLILDQFNQVSFYSVLVNLLVVPLALFSAAGGMALLLGSPLHPALGNLFGAACEAPLRLLTWVADLTSHWPKVEWIVASPPAPWMALYHALLLAAFFLFWPRPKPQDPSPRWLREDAFFRKGRRVWGWVAGCFLLAALGAWVRSGWGPGPFRAAYLAVGHGNAVVLRSPGGRVMVLDGGKGTKGPDRFHVLATYLRHEGVDHVEAILMTHPDEDHVGGLVNLLGALPVGKAYEGERAEAASGTFRAFEERAAGKGVSLVRVGAGARLEDLDGVSLRVLHPSRAYFPRLHLDNNLSLATLASYGGETFLFPGDLEKDGLLRLFRDQPSLGRVDWLIAPHHGRRSGEPGLCAGHLRPRFAVLSDRWDHPEDHVLFQEAWPGARVLSTAEEGAIEVEVFPDGTGRYRTYRDGHWVPFGPMTPPIDGT